MSSLPHNDLTVSQFTAMCDKSAVVQHAGASIADVYYIKEGDQGSKHIVVSCNDVWISIDLAQLQ